MADDLQVTSGVSIPRAELDESFTTSGGPGGQHANKTATRVELRLDLVATTALSDHQRKRAIERFGADLRVTADDTRSQARNRTLAEQRLAERLAEAIRPPRTRRPTRPTKGSKRRRLQAKRQRSETKRLRQRPTRDE